jgi:hypothetical protein
MDLEPAENCPPSSSLHGCDVVAAIRAFTNQFGNITTFKAYLQTTAVPYARRSDLQSSGVSLIDCPHMGRKNVADQMMIGASLVVLCGRFNIILAQWI